MVRVLFILLLLCQSLCYGQYTVTEEIKTALVLNSTTDIDKGVAYKFVEDKLVFFFDIVKNDTSYIVYNKLELATGRTIEQDTLLKPNKNFTIYDIVATEHFWMAISSGSYIYKKKGETATFNSYPDFSKYFKKGYLLNKNEVILYSIYDFHPADGKAGVFLNVFDINAGGITKSVVEHYAPVILSPMNNGWLTAGDNNIYVFSPLNDTVQVYNENLKLKAKKKLAALGPDDVNKNLALEKMLDSTYSAERKRMDAIVSKYPKDSLRYHVNEIQSDVLEKPYSWSLMQKVRKEYAFIEKAFIYDQQCIGITISRPEYKDNYRDVVIYDMKKDKVKKVFTKWQCKTDSVIKRKEDFYTINLQRFEKRYPYFYKDKAYAVTLYDPQYFTTGTEEMVQEKFQKSILKQGYLIYILMYDIVKP